MRIATWNINSIRTRAEHLARFTTEAEPDVVCLQEIKVAPDKFPAEACRALGYPYVAVHGQKGYNGVAILSKLPFDGEERWSWWGQDDARHLTVRFPDAFDLHVFYVPSGGPKPDTEANPKFAHKLGFIDEMIRWSRDARLGERKAVILGDLNVAPLETDVWNHKTIKRQVGHTPTECARMAELCEAADYTDVGRYYVPPDAPLYTWWGYRHPQSFEKNYGWRLDHVWVTPPLVPHLRGHRVHHQTRAWDKPSDHVPVVVDLA